MEGALSIRLLGAVLIITSAVLASAGYVEPYKKAISLMLSLNSAMTIMKNELTDRMSTVPELIAACASATDGRIKLFFEEIQASLSALGDVELRTIWKSSAEKQLGGLPDGVLRELIALGNILGTSDTRAQTAQLECIMSTINETVSEAEKTLPEKRRLSGGIGMSLCGLLLIILM